MVSERTAWGERAVSADRGRIWTLAIFCFVFAEAVAMQARGPILASLEGAFGVSEAALGLVAPAGTIGFLVAILATGLLAGRIDMQRTLTVSIVFVVGALAVMSVAPLYAVFLVGLLLQGTASGVFRGGDRVVLSHLHPGRRGRIYAAYTLVWAVGAVVGPQLVSLVLAVFEWRVVFVVVALCFLPSVVLATRVSLPSMDAERSLSGDALRELLRRPPIVGACVAMVFVGAIEGVMFTWLAYYAGGFYATTTANLLLSVYLVAYVPARLAYAYAVERIPYLALLFVATLPVVPALAVAFSGVSGLPLFVAAFVVGAGISGGYPTLSAYAVEAAPEYSGPLNGLTSGASYVGMGAAPAVVGIAASRYGIRIALWTTVFVAVALVVATAVTWLWTGTVDAPTPRVTAD